MGRDSKDLTTLLRVLAGRIEDGQLAHRWGDLAAQDPWELERNLLGYLAKHAIPLRDEEIALLPEGRIKPDGIQIRRLTRWRPSDPVPKYRFTPLDPDDSPAERHLLGRAPDRPTLRRIRKALRSPANEAAIAQETVVYVAECTPDSDISRLHGFLDVSRHGEQTQVVAEGEELPPYHADALAVGRLIWTRGRD
ncbi:hypothetical protein [Allokutzneria albata]|uniref:Uncharacterized protein n=1 Tax=Allokutzneria albata TaxID=211114 RepID=A0A1G9V997_ALLAB|nr:hypothetical protein [Allokutzneria albata]SDM68739.1 hypothetical protein SAMN04489726_2911 [Allokutzneria albata]